MVGLCHRIVLWAVVVLTAPPLAADAAPCILVLGDSLSAAYGIDVDESWVAKLQQRLDQRGADYRVVNGSISGETTRGALARLPELLATYRPSVLLVELGGNDGLRGIALEALRDNLEQIIRLGQEAGARPVLVGMRLPPNYGPAYMQRFEQLYRALGEEYQVPVSPFILEGVAGDPELMQADGIHPKQAAQARMLDNLWPTLERLL